MLAAWIICHPLTAARWLSRIRPVTVWSTQRAKSLLAACRALCVRASAAAAHMLLLLFNTTRTTSGPPSTGAHAAAVQHNAHTLRTPKHEGLYRYGRRCGRYNLAIHRPLIGRRWGRGNHLTT